VDEVGAFFDSPQGIPVRVREFELFHPSGGRALLSGEALRPDLENQYNFAYPLLALCDSGAISAPALDRRAFHRLRTEVLLLAGRYDHTVDYRSVFALWAGFPNARLFMADDNHVFAHLEASGDDRRLMRAFLTGGADSAPFRQALERAEPRRWKER
jgi:pimeloyl-ACP methyl ester carboxylesterase